MRTAAAVIVWASCAHPTASTPSPPAFDVAQRSKAVLDAFDHDDIATVETSLAPGFVHVEGDNAKDRAGEVALLHHRTAKSPHISERTWANERSFVAGADATFTGIATERSAGARGGYSYEGRYTLAWHFEEGAWKLALWTWQRAGAAAESDTWNDVFKHGIGFEKQPNKLLVETVKGVAPATALDILMGQGRNAIFLATQGWRTTGIDFSHEGITQARAAAADKHVALDAIEADIETTDLGTAKYDLVTMIYAGDDAKLVAKAQAALKPGGLFIYEYFHGKDQPGAPEGFGDGELAKLFEHGYTILRDDVVDDTADWATDRAKLERFVARKN